MYYIVKTKKSFSSAVIDLKSSVINHGYGVLHIHDLGATLRSKGNDFSEECKIFEVCNPAQAAKVLTIDMCLNMALPCRISVFTEKDVTKIGMIKPEKMLGALSQNVALSEIAKEVEKKTVQIIDEAQ